MFRRSKAENKAKLEHKLYLARATPEPEFDLSDCDLKQVPSGIYSLCKVFLKEILRLENNQLNSLSHGGNVGDLCNLQVLDLHANHFTQLPQEIGLLVNLRELNVSDNALKKLPDSLCHLKQLHVLNAARNQLKSLPENLGFLVSLQFLCVVGNKQLKSLPKSMHKCTRLVTLELDVAGFQYPPENVAENGTEAILNFICDDLGVDYSPEIDVDPPPEKQQYENVEAKLWTLESIKNQRVRDFLEIEKQNELQQRQEFELATAQKTNRDQLLADISQQQSRLDQELEKVHREKEVDRFRLIEQLIAAENHAEMAVKRLLESSSQPHCQLLEFEKEEEQRLLDAANKYNQTLRKHDILRDMDKILQQEMEKFRQFDEDRSELSRGFLEQEVESDLNLARILRFKETHKVALVSQLQQDAQLQKAAVCALLERGDARSWGLVQQVALVEAQLAALTSIEMDRKMLQLDQHLNDLAQKRISLSILLMDLMEQQKERRMQLLTTLKLMEESTSEMMEDFWLKQYQRLLDKLPEGLSEAQKNMDPLLVQALLLNGVLSCLPFLAKLIQCHCQIAEITTADLTEAGITDTDDQTRILNAFHTYNKERDVVVPSAPVDEASAAPPVDMPPTAPSGVAITTSECVVCMDTICEIIYVPCGHFCCCTGCSATLVICPMCRADIEKQIRVRSP